MKRIRGGLLLTSLNLNYVRNNKSVIDSLLDKDLEDSLMVKLVK